jgi:hypothetical protein
MRLRILIFISLCGFTSCKKYLNEVSDRSLAVLTTIDQYQQLLNQNALYVNAPTIVEYGTDDFYIYHDAWYSSIYLNKNSYVWENDIYEGNTSAVATQDWRYPYEAIYYANVVLDGMEDISITENEKIKFNEIKGHAYFMRAYQHYLLQELYGQPYKPETANTDLGIPLKLTADLSEKVFRATVENTFKQIISDSEKALSLVSLDYQEVNRRNPSKATIYAFLSRIYLTMQEYELSLTHSNKCLSYYDKLLNYNDLKPNYVMPFPDNKEVLFTSRQRGSGGFLTSSNTYIDSTLYGSYEQYDLRKEVFFQLNKVSGKPFIKSMYSGTIFPSASLATDEVYLNRAECKARLGDPEGALVDLNALLVNRYLKDHFSPLDLISVSDVLGKVLEERRKEMVFRGTRWTDLRRLNQDSQRAITLKRVLGNNEYFLPPNSPRYTYPIPLNEVARNNWEQNERY